jgi:hypothetical protein
MEGISEVVQNMTASARESLAASSQQVSSGVQ